MRRLCLAVCSKRTCLDYNTKIYTNIVWININFILFLRKDSGFICSMSIVSLLFYEFIWNLKKNSCVHRYIASHATLKCRWKPVVHAIIYNLYSIKGIPLQILDEWNQVIYRYQNMRIFSLIFCFPNLITYRIIQCFKTTYALIDTFKKCFVGALQFWKKKIET